MREERYQELSHLQTFQLTTPTRGSASGLLWLLTITKLFSISPTLPWRPTASATMTTWKSGKTIKNGEYGVDFGAL